jgi:hypothetical protein
VVFFPHFSELIELFAVESLTYLSFVVFFEFGDALVLINEFLEVTSALGGSAGLQKLRNKLEYFADSTMIDRLLSFVFGCENTLVIVDK